MNIQLLLLFGVLSIALLYPLNPTLKRKKTIVQAITVVLSLFSGLRSWWMGDLIKYYTLYRRCNGADWRAALTENWSNMGIRVFFRLTGAVGISYDVCIFIIAVFAAISLGFIIYRYSGSPFISYLMYIGMGFLIFTYSGLKQTIAMGFLCFAMNCLLEDHWKGFVLWTLVGGFFHAPALIFLFAYPFAHKKIDEWYLIFLASGFILVFAFRNQIVALLSRLYFDDLDAFSISSGLVGGRFLMMLLILAVCYYLRPVRREDATYAKVFNVMVLAALLQTFSVFNNVFTRLTDYLFQFIVIFLPMALFPKGCLAAEHAELESPGFCRYREVYTAVSIAITVYAIYYYIGLVDSSYLLLKDFRFFWQINPYGLYGS